MSDTDTATAISGNGATAQPRPAAASVMPDRKAVRKWWRVVAQPSAMAIGFLVLVVIGAASSYLVVRSQFDTGWVTHTLQIQDRLLNLRLIVHSAESDQRGYLLGEGYLDFYRHAIDSITPAIMDLKAGLADNPSQQQALAVLETIITRKFDEMRETIRLQDAGDRAAALALVRTGAGHILMVEILRQSEKRGDELQAAVNELEAFSYNVSHDLRAPLRSIHGFSQIVLTQHGSALDPDAREHLQSVTANAVQMGHLVDDLLAFSRLGRQLLNKQQVPMTKIIEQALGEVRQRAEGRSVSVSVGHVPPVWGDAVLLRQVFKNLIDNAFKYTRLRADATVEIGSRNTDGEQIFFVRDNGCGFDMQYADKVFDVFQRLHRVEDFEGTGSGLAIVRRIVQRHGGRIWAEAAVDKGATFYFTTEAPGHADERANGLRVEAAPVT
jgi:signal transduction histidine kinase